MIKQRFIKDFIERPIKEYWNDNSFSDIDRQTFKYSDVAQYIVKMHLLFERLGIKRGDKIALIGKNSAHWSMSYLSVVTYGAVIVPVLVDFHPREVHHIVNHSDSVLLIASEAKWKELDFGQMPNLKAVFVYEPLRLGKSRVEGIESILQQVEQEFSSKYGNGLKPDDIDFADIPNSELVEISYTSGSTGNPKGVMLTANNLAANVDFANRNMPLKPGDSLVSILPLAHSFGCAFEFLFPFNRGVHIHFLSRKPSPQVLLKAYQDIRPALILSVPLVFEKIYRNKILPQINKPSVKFLLKLPLVKSLIYKKIRKGLVEALGGNFAEVVLGGAPLNEEVERFFRKIKFPYTVGYGMTECGPLISYAPWYKNKFRSCGKVVDTLEAKVDWHDEAHTIGEIWVKGENVMLGYYKNPEATAQVLDDEGWLHTGDLGIIDSEGYIFIKGRAKSLLLGPSGENIFPEEIEDLYANKPYVGEILVVMREHRLWALIYPDFDQMEKDNIGNEQVAEIYERYRNEINDLLPRYKQVYKIEIRKEPFEKTPKRNIKRFLYS